MIINPNGKQYTTVAEDMRMKALKSAFRQHLAKSITEAMQNSRDGRLQLSLPDLESFLDQAYLAGREDGAGK